MVEKYWGLLQWTILIRTVHVGSIRTRNGTPHHFTIINGSNHFSIAPARNPSPILFLIVTINQYSKNWNAKKILRCKSNSQNYSAKEDLKYEGFFNKIWLEMIFFQEKFSLMLFHLEFFDTWRVFPFKIF